MQTHLEEKTYLNTYNAVLQQPIARGVPWQELRTMLKEIGEVVHEPRGVLKVSRNGQTLVLRQPYNSELAGALVLAQVRRFLQEADRTKTIRQFLIATERKHNHEEVEGTVPFTAYVASSR